MKIARFQKDNVVSYGILKGGEITRLTGDIFANYKETNEKYIVDKVKILAPVSPPNIIAIGLNYKTHADESKVKYPSAPVVFIKTTNTVIGPVEDIVLPEMASDEVDYEAELAIVIKKMAKNISEEDALNYVFGYTCGNDVSARDCQLKHDTQWARGKSFDTFCPLGPCIETEMAPDNVFIKLKLNGEIMQDSNTSHMIFSCRALVSYISRCMTLLPGTVIMTGTPGGVGFSRKPPVFLKPGDKVEVEIQNIGVLVNNVVRG